MGESAVFRLLADRLLPKLPGRIARHGHALLRRRSLRALRDARAPRVLIATNDLSRSGAPLLVFEIARLLADCGYQPVVVSPADGPFGRDLRAREIPVLIDPGLNDRPMWLTQLADIAHLAICNTVDTAGVVAAIAGHVPTLWYLHEVSLLRDRLGVDLVRRAIGDAATVWAGSEVCAEIIRPLRGDVATVPYGVEPLGDVPQADPARPLRVAVFGSIEPRKGQDLAVEAYRLLDPAERSDLSLRLYGRRLDKDFAKTVLQQAADSGIDYGGELDRTAYVVAMRETDAVLVCSREDTLPLVSIDALGLGRMLLLTPTVGTKTWLTPGRDAIIGPECSASGVAAVLRDALAASVQGKAMGQAARATFDACFGPDAFKQRLLDAIASLGDKRRQ